MKGRLHKRRVKELKEGPYTQEEVHFAADHNAQKFLKLKEDRTQDVNSESVATELDSKPESQSEAETQEPKPETAEAETAMEVGE